MKTTILIFAILVSLVVSQKDLIQTRNGNVGKTTPFTTQIIKGNFPDTLNATDVLNGLVTVTVTGTPSLSQDLVVCIQRLVGLPPAGSYNNGSCLYTFVVPKNTPTTTTTSTNPTTTTTTPTTTTTTTEPTTTTTTTEPTTTTTTTTTETTTTTTTEPTTTTTTTTTEPTTTTTTTTTTTEPTTTTTEPTTTTTTTTTEPTTTTTTTTTTTEPTTTTTEPTTTTTTTTTEPTTTTTTTTTEPTTTTTTTTTEPTTTTTTTTTEPTTTTTTTTTEPTTTTTTTTTEPTTTTTTTTTEPTTTTTTTTTEPTTTTTTEPTTTTTTTTEPTTTTTTTTTEPTTTTTTGTGPEVRRFYYYITTSGPYSLQNDLYNVGVFFKDTTVDSQNVTVAVSFKYCTGHTGNDCSIPINSVTNNQPINVSTATAYFNYTTPSSNDPLTNLTINLSPSAFNTLYNISARYNGLPDGQDTYSVINGNSLVIPHPQQGLYYVSITANQTASTNFTSTTGSCVNKTGPNCDIALTNASAAFLELWKGESLDGNAFRYYFLTGFTPNTLQVAAKPNNKDRLSALKLYAAFNRIPVYNAGQVSNADLSGCTGSAAQCSNFVTLSTSGGSSSVQGTWYVLLVNSGAEKVEFNVWFNSSCPNGCSGQGNCNQDSGVCSCNTNFQGLACSEDNMFIEYVILIIIAALVLISALLGLIAWAYMRKRHSQYEVIKN